MEQVFHGAQGRAAFIRMHRQGSRFQRRVRRSHFPLHQVSVHSH